jgi:hypothetical protein
MAGGPLHPISVVHEEGTGEAYPDVYIGDGGTSPNEVGWGIEASLGADATLNCRFEMPQVLPSGTAKLRIISLADAVTGNARINPKWRSVAIDGTEDPSDTALTAEGVQTVSWSTGDDDQYIETLIDLDADTIVADEMVVMDIVFETASWTLAVVSVHNFSIVWQ